MTEVFDAEEFLNKKDIWNHPFVSDRNNKNSYEVAELMAEFANERTELLSNFIPVEKELPAFGEVVIGTDGKSFACLCLRYRDNPEDDWCWSEVKGIWLNEGIICEDEGEMDDLDIRYWHKLPVFKINESNDER